jgi:hypothetical protein
MNKNHSNMKSTPIDNNNFSNEAGYNKNDDFLKPTDIEPHPLILANSFDNTSSIKRSESDDIYPKNDNKNFNCLHDSDSKDKNIKITSFNHTFNLPKCLFDEVKNKIPINPTEFLDCNQAMNKLNRFNRNTPEYQLHAAEWLKFLSSLWITRTMCDLALKISNRKYLAHRLGLAMFSSKYRQAFNKDKNAETFGVYTIILTDTTDVALEAILKYIYTAEVDINPSNADEILNGAKELGIDNLICMVQDYFNSLSIGDILIFMANVFDKDGGELATYQIYSYFMNNLNKISRTPEYARVSIFAVKAILEDSNLQVFSETEVFDAAMKWIDYDKAKRKTFLSEIMRCVRFTLMTPHEIHGLTEECQFFNDKELLLMVLNAFKYHSFKCCNNLALVKCEEKRNVNLHGTSVPDNFIYALKELANKACLLKDERKKLIGQGDCPCCVNIKSYCLKCRGEVEDDLLLLSCSSDGSAKKCGEINLSCDDDAKKLYEKFKLKNSKKKENKCGYECFSCTSKCDRKKC